MHCHRILRPALAPAVAMLLTSLACIACDKSESSTGTAPSASVPPGPVLKTFHGLGITFQYPEPYVADTATTNPTVHQIALDHNKEPGVLTIRFNPQDPSAPIAVDDVATAAKQRMGAEATVAPAKLEVAGEVYEARAVKTNQLGLVPSTDVVAVVPLGKTNYVVLTHTADDDQAKAQKMFDVVLRTLAAE